MNQEKSGSSFLSVEKMALLLALQLAWAPYPVLLPLKFNSSVG